MKISSCILLCLPFLSFGQIPVDYYNTAVGLTGNNLKTALHHIIKDHTVIPNSVLWSAFSKTDAKVNGKVWDIYSFQPVIPQPYEFTFITNECGSYSIEGDCYGQSLMWPAAWLNGATAPSNDLFNVYPTDGLVNSVRANFPFGNTILVDYMSFNGTRRGTSSHPSYSLTVFEPISEFKGDVARSYLYMTTRYYTEDAAWGTSPATNKADILPWQMNVLMQWHHFDPVSAKEIARNDSIYTFYQQNRNPFIDHPNWADSIWTYVASVPENLSDLSNAYSVYPNPSEDRFYIKCDLKFTDDLNYTVQTITGEVVEQKIEAAADQITIETKNWPKGLYIISLRNKTGIAKLKLIKN